jgi:hypothetical protein
MSDTPRTDRAALQDIWIDALVASDFARELERDLIAAQGYRAAAEEIAKRRGEMVDALTAERDEARREICNVVGRGQGQRLYAADRGWDCFDAKEGQR